MPTATKKKRLDKIELQLTPKEWAIRLADELRRHSSDADFLKSMAKGTYRELPFVRPFYALAEQAEEHCPGSKPEDIHATNQLNRKLRTEFHALKVLIAVVNETIQSKAETNRLKVALKLSTLHMLILQDAFAGTARKVAAWVEECKTADKEEEHQVMLMELSAYSDMISADGVVDKSHPTSGHRPGLPSLIENWADDLAMLIMEVFACRAAVQAIQERYFDDHPILCREIEATLETTLQAILDAVATFNEYMNTRADLLDREWNQNGRQEDGSASGIPGQRDGNLNIDVEAIRNRAEMLVDFIAGEWVQAAKDEAVADILKETGAHQDFVWQRFQEKAGRRS